MTQYWEALCVVFAKFLAPIRKIFRRVRPKTPLPFEMAAILLVTRPLRFPSKISREGVARGSFGGGSVHGYALYLLRGKVSNIVPLGDLALIRVHFTK